MTELEHALLALGREVEFPPVPDLVPRVRERLEGHPRGWSRPLALAVAIALVAFGIAMAVPPARSAILRFFHIGAVTVERVETLPRAEERPLAAGLGAPLSREEAERRAGFRIHLPPFKGPPPNGFPPTRYYARPGVIATFLHSGTTPILLVELRGDQAAVGKKFVGPETRVEPAQIGQFGIWLAGGEHVLIWQFGDQPAHQIVTRLAGNVLIWVDRNRTYRLEGDLDKSQMLELARQIPR